MILKMFIYFKLNEFGDILDLFLLMIYNFILLWSDNMLYMILIFGNLLQFVLWLHMCSVLVSIPWALEKKCILKFSDLAFNKC